VSRPGIVDALLVHECDRCGATGTQRSPVRLYTLELEMRDSSRSRWRPMRVCRMCLFDRSWFVGRAAQLRDPRQLDFTEELAS
jgi:hypothetical protein